MAQASTPPETPEPSTPEPGTPKSSLWNHPVVQSILCFKWVGCVRPTLDMIERGNIFRVVVGTLVQVLAVLFLITGVIYDFVRLIEIFSGKYSYMDLTFAAGVAALLCFLFILVGVIALSAAAFIRGGDIRRMPDQQYTVMGIFVRLVRLYGELIMIWALISGVLLMLVYWCTDPHMLIRYVTVGDVGPLGALGMLGAMVMAGLIYALAGTNMFLAGIYAWILAWLAGFIALVCAYFVAELIAVLFSIADDMKRTRQAVEPRNE